MQTQRCAAEIQKLTQEVSDLVSEVEAADLDSLVMVPHIVGGVCGGSYQRPLCAPTLSPGGTPQLQAEDQAPAGEYGR